MRLGNRVSNWTSLMMNPRCGKGFLGAELHAVRESPRSMGMSINCFIDFFLNPTLPLPVPPIILLVAVMLPVVEKLAPTLIPWLPDPDPPLHPAIVFVPSEIEAPKVNKPEVPVVQPVGRETP